METTTDIDVNRVLEVSMKAGRILLENGAEIFRVEDTMKRIAAHFGVEEENFFVLSNGIFTTGSDRREKKIFAKVEHIPVHGADLYKVVALNQLSREICLGRYTLSEVEEKLDEIKKGSPAPKTLTILATALGAGCFAVLLDGTIWDGLFAALSGLALGLFMVFISGRYLSKITGNILGAALVSLICVLCNDLTPVPSNMMSMIAGAIIPLVPGVAFVNGIRDIGDGDYISGAVRLLDATLVFICIATGVGVVLSFHSYFMGGIVL